MNLIIVNSALFINEFADHLLIICNLDFRIDSTLKMSFLFPFTEVIIYLYVLSVVLIILPFFD